MIYKKQSSEHLVERSRAWHARRREIDNARIKEGEKREGQIDRDLCGGLVLFARSCFLPSFARLASYHGVARSVSWLQMTMCWPLKPPIRSCDECVCPRTTCLLDVLVSPLCSLYERPRGSQSRDLWLGLTSGQGLIKRRHIIVSGNSVLLLLNIFVLRARLCECRSRATVVLKRCLHFILQPKHSAIR